MTDGLMIHRQRQLVGQPRNKSMESLYGAKDHKKKIVINSFLPEEREELIKSHSNYSNNYTERS